MKKDQKQKSILTMLLLDRSSGFSLAEVMVGAGILGALSLVVMNLTQNINRSQRSMENKFQVGQVFSQAGNALRNRGGCSATVTGLLRAGAPGTQVNGIFDGVGVGPIFSVGQVLGGITEAGGVGVGGGAIITVSDIRLIAYVDEDGQSTADPDGEVTNVDDDGNPVTRDYGSALLRLTLDRGNTLNAANATVQDQVSAGLQTFQRDYRLKILVNPGNNLVVGCYAIEESVVEAACEALDGLFSHTDGRCREIKVQEDPTNADSNYAITSRGATLVQEGGLRVGQYDLDEAIPGTGNLVLQNNAQIGGNASVEGNLLVRGTGHIEMNTGIGIAPGVARLTVQGNGVSIGNPGFSGGDDILNLLNGIVGQVHLSKQSNRTSFRVDTTNTTNNFIQSNINGTPRFTVTHQGQILIPQPAASTSPTNPSTALEIGSTSNADYYAAYIRNQPANPAIASHFGLTGQRGDEVATKRWAASVIYSNLTDAVSVDILNNINDYVANNQLDTIKRMICQSGRARLTIGSGAENVSATVIGNYVSPTCTYSPAFCNGTGSTQRCGVIHVSGINSTGEILATGAGASIRVAGTGTVTIANIGTITASSTISSDTLVTAPTVRGLGGAASQGVCTANGCATRFGRQFCSGNAIMIGIAYGRIVCAGAGSSYAP